MVVSPHISFCTSFPGFADVVFRVLVQHEISILSKFGSRLGLLFIYLSIDLFIYLFGGMLLRHEKEHLHLANMIDFHNCAIQGVFPPHAQCSRERLRFHCDPDQDRVLIHDE